MKIKEYISSIIYGVLLGFILDKTISSVATKYKLSNYTQVIIHIMCIMCIIYVLETYVCESFVKWRNSGCGTLFFVSFFSIQVNLYNDIYSVLETFTPQIKQSQQQQPSLQNK